MSTQFRAKSDRVEQSNGSHIVHLVQIDDNNDKTVLIIVLLNGIVAQRMENLLQVETEKEIEWIN
jgi:hypothetical protein